MATEPRLDGGDVRPSLFQRGDFVLASLEPSDFKIECDALSDEDWATLAMLLSARVRPFSKVVGVPQGGLPLADALRPYVTYDAERLLVVDDVWTTGSSMRDYEVEAGKSTGWTLPITRAVVFARRPVPIDVTALFVMTPERRC